MIVASRNPVWEGSGRMIADQELTEEQWDALIQVQKRWKIGQPMTVISCGDYIMVRVAGMVLGIEKDGYTHS